MIKLYWVATKNIFRYNQYTSKSKIEYCSKWGYTYKEYDILDNTRPAAWSSLLALKDIFIKYSNINIVLKTDADTMIMNQTLSINKLLSSLKTDITKYHFIIAKDINGINSGVYIAIRQPDIINVIDDLYYNVSDEDINHIWWEQLSIMNYYKKYPEKFLIVPQKFFNSYTEYHIEHPKDAIFTDGDFIVHSPGGDDFLNRELYFRDKYNHIKRG